MKVIFITQNDPFYTKYFFDRYLQIYPDIDYELLGVFFLPPMNDSLLKLIKRTVNFYGKTNFLKMGARYALIKTGEKFGLKTTAFNFLKKAGVKVSKIKDVNDKKFLDWIDASEVELIISISAPQIFKQGLLEAAYIACVNIHSGLIPAYRGLFPNFWQMLNGENSSTVTFHQMEAKIDKGNIVAEFQVKIDDNDSLTDLIRKTKFAAAENVGKVINMYRERKVKLYEHADIAEHYYKFPGKEDIKRFLQTGRKLI